MMCMGSSFVACTLASWLKCSCSSKSYSLALASLWSVALTIAPSRKGWTVSRLWLLGCKLLFASFLISSCLKRALVWGNCRERLCEFFVRVLHSSRVNLIMQIIQTCSVCLNQKSFYFVNVVVLNSVLQKQFYKCSF